MVTTVTAIGGLVGLIVSLVFLALQTRAVSQQVLSSNKLAGARVLDPRMAGLWEIHLKMLEYPGMRSHFYESVPVPTSDPHKERVMTFAEMMADVLGEGLQALERIPESDNDEWVSYCRFVLDQSPAVLSFVEAHPDWWSHLAALT
ncbi:hypothetical protein OG806_02260 [Streptomyces sp. NBC_00882]|uniref:hypothetical protein n=1 Tax=Streptomyces TaxID=1883 RepID=UPI0038639764|nr:hypothetical protein OG806_02260 [Streptomyces sp. NBC_00882]WSZ55373.1 hypothetical protein OH824_01835 [Streptomyces canus]